MYGLLLIGEVAVLYFCGKYALWRVVNPQGLGRSFTRLPYYGLVAPGIIAHETAHLLACLLTQTRVVRFRPFRPQRDPVTGQVVRLGSVEFERPSLPFVRGIIGVAPLIVNPVLLVFVTAVLAPFYLSDVLAFAAAPQLAAEALSSFAVVNPLIFVLWCWAAGSLALGSSLSASDRAGLVPAGVMVGLLILLAYAHPEWMLGPEMITRAQTLAQVLPLPPAEEVLRSLSGLYSLPAGVAALAAAGAWATRR